MAGFRLKRTFKKKIVQLPEQRYWVKKRFCFIIVSGSRFKKGGNFYRFIRVFSRGSNPFPLPANNSFLKQIGSIE